jgi:hypothetical protein
VWCIEPLLRRETRAHASQRAATCIVVEVVHTALLREVVNEGGVGGVGAQPILELAQLPDAPDAARHLARELRVRLKQNLRHLRAG